MNVIAKYWKTVLFIGVFIVTLEVIQPFTFGLGDNVEELPLIYKQVGIAEYPEDIFVSGHTDRYTVVTPYIVVLSTISKLFPFIDFQYIFFFLQCVLLTIFYLTVRLILRAFSRTNEFKVFFCMIIILFIHISKKHFMPEGSAIFVNKLDPTFASGVLFGLAIALLIQRKTTAFLIVSIIGTLIHPLYAILLIPGFVSIFIYRHYTHHISKTEKISYLSFLLIIIGYSFYIWIISRQTMPSAIDSVDIYEMHLPGHNKIPKLIENWKELIRFYTYSFGTLSIGGYLLLHTKKYVPFQSDEKNLI